MSERFARPFPTGEGVVTALPGSALIGFLAALGLLGTLRRAGWPARLAWGRTDRGWRATVAGAGDSSAALAAAAHARLAADGPGGPWATIAEAEAEGRRPMAPRQFVDLYRRADLAGDEALAAALDAYGVAGPADRKAVPATAFRLTSGQQGFARLIREVSEGPGLPAALVRALACDPWRYEDPGPALRWDERDLRLRAYRAHDPADQRADPIRTERGAVRLAVEALGCLPVLEAGGGVQTRSWVETADGPAVRWPVWDAPLSASEVGALVSAPALYDAEDPEDAALRALGVAALWESKRGQADRYGGVLAAAVLWAA